ncbi:LysM peptidoglycan-binding domain-containing protein [Paenibacillus polymyxa]|uniref:LysM peptidoglycan-binding domain-containing protein n=1 Tax=Paenibacillus polymyxa TaxID=1406 RepID=UPI002024126D|nr:LysM peptidoglycan-binding domain-containing protein [Paenibacillus polymyxa]URJ46373.1 LysM peptidoglycan-binding domain-containing protein [Paenibacillus polymyxa]
MEEHGIFLSYNNQEEAFRIPVNPEELSVKEAGDGSTYKIVGGDEINAIQSRKLTEISFSSFLPGQLYPFVNGDELLPIPEYIALITKWMDAKRPIRFIYSAISFDPGAQKSPQEIAINMPVTIEEFEWKPVAGTSDIEYTITFKKYVFYNAVQAKVKQTTTKTGAKKTTTTKAKAKRPNEKVKPKSVKVKAGDTLWIIAKKNLGDGSRYKEIQTLNKITNAQAKRLKVGQVLRLPG